MTVCILRGYFMRILIGADLDGKTVKEVIKNHRLSTRLVTRLKTLDDGILVNGTRRTVRHILANGDLLELKLEDRKSSEGVPPFNAPIELLWEDEYYAAFAKPPHLPTHPARHHQSDTLAGRIAYYFRDRDFIFRALTRLDLDTSGVVIVAKNQLAANEFSKLLIKRTVKKEYTAVCLGKIADGEGTITLPIIRPDERSILRDVGENGEEAITEYKVLKTCDKASLVSVSPITGRTHQIRVHMKAIGHPVFGDTLYSLPDPLIDRQALHASKITFIHPFTKETVSVECPLFDDMKSCISKLFGDR